MLRERAKRMTQGTRAPGRRQLEDERHPVLDRGGRGHPRRARAGPRLADRCVNLPALDADQLLRRRAYGSAIAIGGRILHARASGAFTGSISAEMLADLGAKYVIVGHSERRAYHHETDDGVHAKALGARRAGLCGIICVGETIEEREQAARSISFARSSPSSLPKGATAADTVIAYEPVWAIVTGRTPTPKDIAEVHASLREMLDKLAGDEAQKIRILYGGSVKPSNAREILSLENVDGALVGGASLVPRISWDLQGLFLRACRHQRSEALTARLPPLAA